MLYIFDIETYRNYFGCIFKNPKTQELTEFIIYKDRNDFDELAKFIDDNSKWFVGYNSYNFDNQLLNFIHKNKHYLTFQDSSSIAYEIYKVASQVIEIENYNQFKYNLPFRFIDLMKVANLNMKSLKLVGTSLKWHKLQDLPIEWDKEIQPSDLETLHLYNLNDVEITELLYNRTLPAIKLRFAISKKYNINAYSESDSGIANRLLEKFYSDSTGISTRDFTQLRTERPIIQFKHVVFDQIEFETQELNDVLENVITHTYYKSLPFFTKTFSFGGVEYKMGVGGLHSVDKGDIFKVADNTKIIDCDVASMYPTIIINHNIHPQHLGKQFIQDYKKVKEDRIESKKSGDSCTDSALKIVLNSSFGKLLYNKHWLYDPLAGLQVTINGQLYLLMLIEMLVLNKFKVISANTDGVITMVDKSRESEYYEICKRWEKKTMLELEYTYYTDYIRRDVNNYIAIKEDGKTKEKGEFLQEIDLKKGFDKPIVSKALYNYFVKGIKVEDTILNHRDIYDFCIAKKTDSKFQNEFHTIKDGEKNIQQLQKTVRFYVSTVGGSLFKVEPDESKMINYCANRKVTVFNDFIQHDDFSKYNIDYNYYISEVNKIIYQIKDFQLKLF